MNRWVGAFGAGIVAAAAALFTLLFSGLGTTCYTDVEGSSRCLTTVNLGVNEFGFSMVLVVFVAALIVGYLISKHD